MKSILKRNVFLALFAVLMGMGVAACSKYEEGPFMSFRSAKNRIENKWKVAKASVDGVGQEFQFHIIDFLSDDTYISTLRRSIDGRVSTTVDNGRWALVDDNKKLRLLSRVNTTTADWEILDLRNNKMKLKHTTDTTTATLELESAVDE